ncbi:uncharacterized protein LOC129790457 [Lutzomyia longipalpis]|uniref:Uncharacterized protein n=2 Tax=Lutzomyia longipalpis TaxID=7200 RepID=A0A1B0EU18_LUTLO|nr:uncharacterized protein LOC129790457 [Lutzomyia longipalpis]
MEQAILPDVGEFEEQELLYFIFCEFTSHIEFKLWRDYMKKQLLDDNLELVEEMLEDICPPKVRPCRICFNPLAWLRRETEENEIEWRCGFCTLSQPILQCNSAEACNVLINLIISNKIHPQILASALSFIFSAAYNFIGISSPMDADDPIQTLLSMYEKSPTALGLGGPHTVVFADIYHDTSQTIRFRGESTSDTSFPILYLADTVAIPTRFFLHPLKYLHNSIETSSSDEKPLVQELSHIANSVIKSGSNLVLGPHLQELISPDTYTNRPHNLEAIVTLESLRSHALDSDQDVWENSHDMMFPAMRICNRVNVLLTSAHRRKPKSRDEYYAALQSYLTSAIWLKTFVNTPFETLLYSVLGHSGGLR